MECSRGPSGDGPETLEAGLNTITLAAGRDARDGTRTQQSEAVATMSIGSRISEQRCEIGWSQVRLADEAGVKQSAIGNIESGLRQRPRELVSIARAPACLAGMAGDWQGAEDRASAAQARRS